MTGKALLPALLTTLMGLPACSPSWSHLMVRPARGSGGTVPPHGALPPGKPSSRPAGQPPDGDPEDLPMLLSRSGGARAPEGPAPSSEAAADPFAAPDPSNDPAPSREEPRGPDDEGVCTGLPGCSGDTEDLPPPPGPAEGPRMSRQEACRLLEEDRAALGSLSLGCFNAGALFNGVQMPKGERWIIVRPAESWGTRETIDFLMAAIDEVHQEFPGTPRIHIGDISDRNGGCLGRHLSHQAGRDVDLGWYYKKGRGSWYRRGTRHNLDIPRTWALVRALLGKTDLELLLIDRRIQLLLREHALSIGEDPVWLRRVLQHPNGRPGAIIRHARGHHTHMHLRFYNRRAQTMGRLVYSCMLARGMVQPPTYYIRHKARRGDSLIRIARRYHSSVKAIRRANGLRSSFIRAGRTYRIPRRGGVDPACRSHRIPPRLTPPRRDPERARVFAKEARTRGRAQRKRKAARRGKGRGRWRTYRVKAGDSLWTIARRHKLRVSDLKRWNRLRSGRLMPGQKLKYQSP